MLNGKDKLKKLGTEVDITKEQDKESKDAVKYFEDIFESIPFSEVIGLNYPTSNWAAIEGYMLKKIHTKKLEFGNKNLLSRKGLEIYNSIKSK